MNLRSVPNRVACAGMYTICVGRPLSNGFTNNSWPHGVWPQDGKNPINNVIERFWCALTEAAPGLKFEPALPQRTAFVLHEPSSLCSPTRIESLVWSSLNANQSFQRSVAVVVIVVVVCRCHFLVVVAVVVVAVVVIVVVVVAVGVAESPFSPSTDFCFCALGL